MAKVNVMPTENQHHNEDTVLSFKSKKPKKPKRRDKSDLGDNFVAPDGGWAWVVCLAAGVSNLSIFPALQQYGFIYRERMSKLGFNNKQITTIVNLVMAISSLLGIVNGAMFRRFTFRQVAITGSILVFVGLMSSAFCTAFFEYVIVFSCIYGIGLGMCMASVSLAINTYFKNRRRRATGFSWTITGLGPIIFPHVSTFLLSFYGAIGTILIYAGISLNALLCALTLQPVLWHVKKTDVNEENDNAEDPKAPLNASNISEYQCKYCEYQKQSKRNIFASQYLFNEDDPDRPGYEITEPGTPMLVRANDGWFGSKLSLTSEKPSARFRQKFMRQNSIHSRCGADVGKEDLHRSDGTSLYKPNYFNRERESHDRYASKNSINFKSNAEDFHCTCAEEKAFLQKLTDEDLKREEERLKKLEEAEQEKLRKLTFKEKVFKFFDLDLLKDITFVNLAFGMTVMMFAEMNFSVLTPFILNSFGYTNEQTSIAMSLLGGMDITVRFLAPLALEKVKLDNRVLFAFGIIAVAIGRFIVTITDSYHVVCAVFILIGFGKGFRTIFSPLIIPSYVPLKRLPAASGLQLIFNTIFSISFGPIIGIITDASSYKMTIHFLNFLTICALLMWSVESIIRRMLRRRRLASQMEN